MKLTWPRREPGPLQTALAGRHTGVFMDVAVDAPHLRLVGRGILPGRDRRIAEIWLLGALASPRCAGSSGRTKPPRAGEPGRAPPLHASMPRARRL